MARKLAFYDRFGVEEYYLYDPDNVALSGWLRGPRGLEPIAEPDGWVSPRLGIRFERCEEEFAIFGPDGRPFLIFEEHGPGRRGAETPARADAESQRADAESQRAEAERQRAERLAARLRELGIDPEA